MDSGTIIAIIIFIGLIIGGVMYFMKQKMPFNYDSSYGENNYTGGKKYMKHMKHMKYTKDKYSNSFCMPTIFNIVFVLFFAYIVYSML
jgi:hypothetical protein